MGRIIAGVSAGLLAAGVAGGVGFGIKETADHYHDRGERLCKQVNVDGEPGGATLELRQAAGTLSLLDVAVQVRVVHDGGSRDGVHKQPDILRITNIMQGCDSNSSQSVTVYASSKPRLSNIAIEDTNDSEIFNNLTDDELEAARQQLKNDMFDPATTPQQDVTKALTTIKEDMVSPVPPRKIRIPLPEVHLSDGQETAAGIGVVALLSAAYATPKVRRRRRKYHEAVTELTGRVMPDILQRNAQVEEANKRLDAALFAMPLIEQTSTHTLPELSGFNSAKAELRSLADTLNTGVRGAAHAPNGLSRLWSPIWPKVPDTQAMKNLISNFDSSISSYFELAQSIIEGVEHLNLRRSQAETEIRRIIRAKDLTSEQKRQLKEQFASAQAADETGMQATAAIRYRMVIDRVIAQR